MTDDFSLMMNWEESGWKQVQLNTWYSPAVYLERLREDSEHLIQCNRLDRLSSKQAPCEYKSEASPLVPYFSALGLVVGIVFCVKH